MLLTSPRHPGRAVRLAYCLNLHPAETLGSLLEGLKAITVPLRERLAAGSRFGVGMYLPAALALRLADPAGAAERERLRAFLAEQGLDPFTWNAFPYGGFGAAGLKGRVFEPTWVRGERAAYTQAVARLAVALAGDPAPGRHLSVSTHTGWHAEHAPDADGQAQALERVRGTSADLERLRAESGWRVVLSLEPEPRSACNDTRELAALLERLRPLPAPAHLGSCLDTCHAAVEFEDPLAAFANATAGGASLGKVQFTSALAVRARGRADLDALLALDESRYLHQVTARTREGTLLRVGDLPELRAALARSQPERWWHDAELRCHFHVPVDLAAVGEAGPATTRDHADATLAAVLARPERWGTDELHVEIETYTWDVLPREARGPGELVDGLEREYAHVLARLAAAGWSPA